MALTLTLSHDVGEGTGIERDGMMGLVSCSLAHSDGRGEGCIAGMTNDYGSNEVTL